MSAALYSRNRTGQNRKYRAAPEDLFCTVRDDPTLCLMALLARVWIYDRYSTHIRIGLTC